MRDSSARELRAEEIHARNVAPGDTAMAPPRPLGSVYMGGFCAPALEMVRVAVIGLGAARGMPQTRLFAAIPHCKLVAVCDVYEDATREIADYYAAETGQSPACYYGSAEVYLRMLEEVRPDAVFIYTPWETHARVAIEVMEHGAHAFVEVPLAVTLEELWRVVDASERTQRHCMMMENVNYGREELLFLNIVRQGLIGELLHGEAAYLHDLRMQMASVERGCGSWRTYHYAARNGNLYPTHGLGSVAQFMSLGREVDTFDRIVSLGSPARGRAAYARKHFPPEHRWNRLEYKCADVSSSIIRTKAGRTILLQWDETSPAPYDRRNMLRGTEGALASFPLRVAGERLSPPLTPEQVESSGFHDAWRVWYEGEAAEKALYEKYEHPLYKRLGEKARLSGSSRGGIDFILLSRVMECLHAGEPLDQNVYEGALWSAVAPLSEKSVFEGGMPQLFPDFTRGDWQTTAPLGIVH